MGCRGCAGGSTGRREAGGTASVESRRPRGLNRRTSHRRRLDPRTCAADVHGVTPQVGRLGWHGVAVVTARRTEFPFGTPDPGVRTRNDWDDATDEHPDPEDEAQAAHGEPEPDFERRKTAAGHAPWIRAERSLRPVLP